MKKALLLICAAVVVRGVLGFSGGNGSLSAPYQVATVSDLIQINSNLSAHYILTANIDMSGHPAAAAIIAADIDSTNYIFDGVEFTGSFDGDAKTIENLSVVNSQGEYLGLFGKIGSGGSVKYLNIQNCLISGKTNIGGLCGQVDGTILNCSVSGVIAVNSSIAGGLCGNTNNATVSGCNSLCSIITGGSVVVSVGGLCGTVSGGTVSNSYSSGSISIDSGVLSYVGGFCGENLGGFISNSYTVVSISPESINAGGFCSNNQQGFISGCFWDSQVCMVNGSSGGTSKTTAQMKTIDTYLAAGWDFVGEQANGFDDIWYILFGQYPKIAETSNSFNGDGTVESPYQISTIADFFSINNDLTTNYVLTNDIDLASYPFNSAVFGELKGSLDGGGHTIRNMSIQAIAGSKNYLGLFSQIASSGIVRNLTIQCQLTGVIESSNFTGSDYIGAVCGSNYGIIDNCGVNVLISSGIGSDYVGGIAGTNYGTIKGSTSTGSVVAYKSTGGLCGSNKYRGKITHCSSSCYVSGYNYTGGVCGSNENYASISYSYATGNVSGQLYDYNAYIGGFCGLNGVNYTSNPPVTVPAIITNCYSTGNVTGGKYLGDQSGGFCGKNSQGHINNCFATGSVFCTASSDYIGGFCGENQTASNSAIISTIANCYAKGAVTGYSRVGGFCGRNDGSVIRNSYSTGLVSGGQGAAYVGGFIGGCKAAIAGYDRVSGCYWDTNTSGMSIGYRLDTDAPGTVAGIYGRSTSLMRVRSVFVGWDFDNESANGTEDMWTMPAATGTPILAPIQVGEPINYIDYSKMALYFGDAGCVGTKECGNADWFTDGVINIKDVVEMGSRWLSIYP